MKLVECVPNFSEGIDPDKIKAIIQEIESVPQIKLLDVDPGATTNRTVVTFIGTPDAVREAAFRAVKKAADVIDMTQHKGAHARMGATDVCPFVPVSGVTMDECVQIANDVARRIAEELHIPCFLYEEAAKKPERKNLATVRAGEYEGLSQKLKDPEWAPDYGEPVFNPKSGATAVGAREFLIAYNINLNTRDKKIAQDIALDIRERGRSKRDDDGNIERDNMGKTINVPGLFKEVKAVGWFIEDYSIAQISINFTNYNISPPHLVFDKVIEEAAKRGVRVTGSELVGLIPMEALLMAGRHYLEKQGKSPGVSKEELINIAALSLGLGDVAPFEPEKKIIEYQFKEVDNSLLDLNLRQFANELSSESPAPGGGSAAALAGALSASLSAMVSNLTVGKKDYEDVQSKVIELAVRGQNLKDEFLRDVDLDTIAFNRVMDAMKMTKKTDEQKLARNNAMEKATKEATLVPLSVLERCLDAIFLSLEIARIGNKNSISDAGVAGLMARAAALGAYYNVLINLPGIRDEKFKTDTRTKAESFRNKVEEQADIVAEIIESELQVSG